MGFCVGARKGTLKGTYSSLVPTEPSKDSSPRPTHETDASSSSRLCSRSFTFKFKSFAEAGAARGVEGFMIRVWRLQCLGSEALDVSAWGQGLGLGFREMNGVLPELVGEASTEWQATVLKSDTEGSPAGRSNLVTNTLCPACG